MGRPRTLSGEGRAKRNFLVSWVMICHSNIFISIKIYFQDKGIDCPYSWVQKSRQFCFPFVSNIIHFLCHKLNNLSEKLKDLYTICIS